MAEMELENWRREMKRRPQAAATTLATQGNPGTRGANRKRNRGIRHGYRTRAARGEEQDEEDIDVSFEKMESLNFVQKLFFTCFFPIYRISTKVHRAVPSATTVTIRLPKR